MNIYYKSGMLGISPIIYIIGINITNVYIIIIDNINDIYKYI